jgi:2-iminobutanoate/2-iminopropanoate deaminase
VKIKRIVIDPDPYEPFRLAQGYRVGDFLFISSQTAIDGSGQIIGVGDFGAQAQQAFENLGRVLRAGGSSLRNIIKVTIFLTDMSNFEKVVDLRGQWFTPPYPADTIVEVSSLYSAEAMIEVEAMPSVTLRSSGSDGALANPFDAVYLGSLVENRRNYPELMRARIGPVQVAIDRCQARSRQLSGQLHTLWLQRSACDCAHADRRGSAP